MEVTTNNHWRQILHWHDLTKKEQSELKDSCSTAKDTVEDSAFFRYKGQIYDLSDFIRANIVPGWHAVKTSSNFSGMVIKASDCGEAIKIGWYCC